MAMVFTVNGVNMLPYVAYQGLKWSRNDVDAPNTGRTMDGTMQRGRVATKIKIEVKCRPLKTAEAQIVLNAILPEYVTVVYTDPMSGQITRTMYSNNNPASFCILKPDGTEYWDGIEFPLVER